MPDATNFSERILGLDTHANRPAATAVPPGTLYSCSDHSIVYRSDGATWSDWVVLGSVGGGEAEYATISGGTESSSGGFDYHAFTSSGTLTVSAPGIVEVLAVGGGGGGGGYYSGGGGGGGGVVLATVYVEANVTITVGAGGAGATGNTSGSAANNKMGVPGEPSKFGTFLVASGGGSGAGEIDVPRGLQGGSGGGGGSRGTQSGGASNGFGNAGGASRTGTAGGTGAGGGGGGAGAAGTSAGASDTGGAGGNGQTVSEFSGFGASGVFGGGR